MNYIWIIVILIVVLIITYRLSFRKDIKKTSFQNELIQMQKTINSQVLVDRIDEENYPYIKECATQICNAIMEETKEKLVNKQIRNKQNKINCLFSLIIYMKYNCSLKYTHRYVDGWSDYHPSCIHTNNYNDIREIIDLVKRQLQKSGYKVKFHYNINCYKSTTENIIDYLKEKFSGNISVTPISETIDICAEIEF